MIWSCESVFPNKYRTTKKYKAQRLFNHDSYSCKMPINSISVYGRAQKKLADSHKLHTGNVKILVMENKSYRQKTHLLPNFSTNSSIFYGSYELSKLLWS